MYAPAQKPYRRTICPLTLASGQLQAFTVNNLGNAGGWDDILKNQPIDFLIDGSDLTSDNGLSNSQVSNALLSALNIWDAVNTAPGLAFNGVADLGENYDVFDGPTDSAGPPWFDGSSATFDQNAHFRIAQIIIGGWLPESYFLNLDPVNGANIRAATWTAKLSGDGSRKPTWHSEMFFNKGWDWTTNANDATGATIDIETVALHELGHEDDIDSVMNSFYAGVQRSLFTDDVNAVTSLYAGGSGRRGKGGGNPNRFVFDGLAWSLTGMTMLEGSVPEPATAVLIVVGCMTCLRCRRG